MKAVRTAVAEENKNMTISAGSFQNVASVRMGPQYINVLGAAYGRSAFTQKVRSLLENGSQKIDAENSVFGDTWPHVCKTLTVVYIIGTLQSHNITSVRTAVIKEFNDLFLDGGLFLSHITSIKIRTFSVCDTKFLGLPRGKP